MADRAADETENHPVSRSGCHPSFVRRGVAELIAFGRRLATNYANHTDQREDKKNEGVEKSNFVAESDRSNSIG